MNCLGDFRKHTAEMPDDTPLTLNFSPGTLHPLVAVIEVALEIQANEDGDRRVAICVERVDDTEEVDHDD
jgi:hypothetical protein